MMDNTSDIRQQKMEEYKNQSAQNEHKENQEAQASQKIEQLLRQVLAPKAKERLSTVRLVNPELYWKAAQNVLYVYQQNPSIQLSDAQLKSLLERLSQKRSTTITRK